MNLEIQLTPEAKAVLGRFDRFSEKLGRAIAAALDRENELTVGAIQLKRLSVRGPDTLGVVTNRLRGSARRTNAQIVRDGVTSSIGSNVAYAGVHEFGFNGTVNVKAFTRKNPRGDKFNSRGARVSRAIATNNGRARSRLAQESSGISQVRAHRRRVNIKARAPFRKGIEERLPNYSAALSRAIEGAAS